MQLDPKEIFEKLTTLGNRWADARYEAELLEDYTKPLLAKLGTQSNEKSQNAREAYAYSHDEYEAHRFEKANARRLEAKARVEYAAAQSWVEVMRTVAATERAANRSAT